jgi:hypothetical protein
MKLADMHKNKGLKINNSIKPHGAGPLPGTPVTVDRREQRKLDQARGLVPFACKLPSSLTAQLRQLAEQRKVEMNDLVEQLLTAGMAAGQGDAPAESTAAGEEKATAKKPAKKAAKKATAE